MKIANIDRKILHNFWTALGISMKFSGKMRLIIILKVTKNQRFTFSLEDTLFVKPQGWGGGGGGCEVKLTPPPPSSFRVKPKIQRFDLHFLQILKSFFNKKGNLTFHISFISENPKSQRYGRKVEPCPETLGPPGCLGHPTPPGCWDFQYLRIL